MTINKKQKRVLRDKAEKAGMSYAAAVNAETPSIPKRRTHTYFAPLSSTIVQDAFDEPEKAGFLVENVYLSRQGWLDMRRFGRDVLNLEFSKEKLAQGIKGDFLGATVWMDPFLKDDEFIIERSDRETAFVQREYGTSAAVSPFADVGEDDLVIIQRGARHQGGQVVLGGQCKVFLGNEQVPLIQHVRFEANVDEVTSRIMINFPLIETDAATDVPARIESYVTRLRRALPFALIGRVRLPPKKNPEEAKFPDPVKTVEDLAAELAKDLSGEKDWHDRVVDETEARVRAKAAEKALALREQLALAATDPDYSIVTDVPMEDWPASGDVHERLLRSGDFLLAAISKKVAELGGATVLSCDDPKLRTVGWVVQKHPSLDAFVYSLRLEDLKAETDIEPSKGAFWRFAKTAAGRAKVAAAFTRGATVETLDSMLEEPL